MGFPWFLVPKENIAVMKEHANYRPKHVYADTAT